MEYYGRKLGNKIVYSPAVAELRRRRWEKIKDGDIVKTSLTVPRKDKSQEQLGAIWGLMISTAIIELEDRGEDTSLILNTDKPTGIRISKRALCDYFYSICPMFNEGGDKITLSDSNTAEAAKFFEDVRNYMASQWGVIIPDPDKNWRQAKEKEE